jgi:hypothetical protein
MAKSDTVQRVARGLSDADHGPGSQSRLSAGFLGYRGASIVPLGDLRGPVGGPTAALSAVDSTFVGVSASILDGPGGPGNLLDGLRGPRAARAARVIEAVSTFLRRGKSSTRQAKRPKWLPRVTKADMQGTVNRGAVKVEGR